tara:strand:+ start:4099 stop:5202 length:1104 start_codon:yes stop_codon:yes gene_type:complete
VGIRILTIFQPVQNLVIVIIMTSFSFAQGFWGNEFPEGKIKYEPKTYVCYKTTNAVILDGKITEKAWDSVSWTDSFVDIEGDLKPSPYHDTRVKMLWDENYFYFAALMEEPHVWATITERDEVIFKDNDFEIFLDPDGDTHNYYELEVNALETEWDLILLKPYHDDAKVAVDSWDIPGLITQVHIDGTLNDPTDTDNAWSVEIAIPWKALEECAPNLHPKEGEQWKVNFSRVHWDTDIVDGKYVKTNSPEFNWVWSPQGLIYMHMPDLWGLVQFTEHAPEKNNVRFNDSKIDQIKWALRQVYYRQRNHYFKNKKYTSSIQSLRMGKAPGKGIPWPPKIVLTPSGWEAAVNWNGQKVIIRKDGKVWAE